MRVVNPWDSKAEVEIDPELSFPGDVTTFGFKGSAGVGERRFLRINAEHYVCLARGDYPLDEVWLMSGSALLAVIGGQGYWITVNGLLACERVGNFPIISCLEALPAHLLVANTFSDIMLVGIDGIEHELRDVVQDDLSVTLDYPTLRLEGFSDGLRTRKSYDLVQRIFLA